MAPPTRRKGKDIPRLPLSAFSPPNTASSDTFPLPPTPSLITPSAVVDSHLCAPDAPGDISHLIPAQTSAVVLTSSGKSPQTIVAQLQVLQASVVGARVLSVLIPFALDAAEIPGYLPPSPPISPTLTTTYDGATPVAPDAEDSKDHPQVEPPVSNLRWALQHGRAVDIDIQGGIMATDAAFYDSFVNLLTKAIKLESHTKRTPVVLTNVLPPPLDSIMPVVMMMNHPTYTTYRQRVSLLSLFENIYVKLLPPTWVLTESTSRIEEKREKLKLFVVPVLEAFGFERIIFGSSPASAGSSPALGEMWYKLVLESFRELAVSQDEMDKIFMENAERIYGSA